MSWERLFRGETQTLFTPQDLEGMAVAQKKTGQRVRWAGVCFLFFVIFVF